MGKGPADWNANVTLDYISGCAVYENNAIQIITWQQFIIENKLRTPLSDSTIQAYIQSAKDYNGGAHPNLGITVEKFMQRLKTIHAIQGGSINSSIFYDPSANQWWGIPKPTMPGPTTRPGESSGGQVGQVSTYCIQGTYGDYANEPWHIRHDRPVPQPGLC